MSSAPKKKLTARGAWEDRFRTPTPDDLFDSLNKQVGSLLDAARERLKEFPGVVEELSWQGLPWRWTLTYRLPGDNGHAWAYLIPDPVKPQIAFPVPTRMVPSLPMNRFKKHVKDGVLQGRMVDNVYWATWEITSKGQLAEIFELARHKHTLSSKQAEPAAKPAARGRQ